jgi:hypothetical protein
VVSFALLPLAACSGVQKLDRRDQKVVTLASVRADPEPYARAMSGERSSNVVVLIPKGESLPAKVEVGTANASLKLADQRVRFNRDVYVRMARGGPLVSPDGERWARAADDATVSKLFGVKRGMVAMESFRVSPENGPELHVNMGDVHRRPDDPAASAGMRRVTEGAVTR